MRRLANQTRDDNYSSKRDYQSLEPRVSLVLQPQDKDIHTVRLLGTTEVEGPHIVGFGVYLRPTDDCSIEVLLSSGTESFGNSFVLSESWNRVGLAIEVPGPGEIIVDLTWRVAGLNVWGAAAGPIDLEGMLAGSGATLSDLGVDHLAPETYYFDHDSALALSISDEGMDSVEMNDGVEVLVKKCSYCGRYLPVEVALPGHVAFHKHSAKVSGHQNECRACKKWRINDSFNPLRTTDQLHESSVITRERKTLLREPEILQRLKKRDGDGLKSIVWKRFDKKCFKCDKVLELADVRLDHTRPLAYLWPLDEHATCLCAVCNGAKTDKFPVDFYSGPELQSLAEITGLALVELQKREVNQEQLTAILADLPKFAMQWDARLFKATADRIKALDADVDLFALLHDENPDVYHALLRRLAERQAPIGDDDADEAVEISEVSETVSGGEL